MSIRRKAHAILETKPQGFRPADSVLRRPRLTQVLVESRATLVLMAAPPGFGKTTLLAEWREVESRPFACVALDSADNDPVVLWSYLAEALRRAEPGFEPAEESADGVLRALQSVDTEIVLVLDDYHAIRKRACHDSLAYFLERAPANVTVALSTRADPPLPLGRLRAEGRLLEVRAADLAFTECEAAQFLNDTLELALTPEDLAVLQQRTEGWPVGVQLASPSLAKVEDRSEFLAQFGGSNRHVVDYLVEVVLDTLEPELRRFLLETSILESMCGPLCDEVTGTHGSAGRLVDIERANLFLVPLDDRREWYRYHQLFSAVLQSQLLRSDPDLNRELHGRASSWYAAEGHTDEAVRHALAAGETEAAIRLVAERWPTLFELGQTETVFRWLDAFPDAVVEGDARLSIAKAWALCRANRRDEALDALAAAEAAGADASVKAVAALLRACFPWGDVTGMLGGANRAHELQGGRRMVWRPAAYLALGRARYFAGEPREAVAPLEQGARAAVRAGQWFVAAESKAVLARAYLALGDEAAAATVAREAVELAELHDLDEQPGAGGAYMALGTVQAHAGRVGEADELLTTALSKLRARGEELYVAEALLALAPVRRAQGERDQARALLAEASEVIEGCPDPGILRGRLEEVAHTLTPAHRRIEGDSELTEREREVLQYLAEGLSKREIGTALFLSFNTIHSHTKSIYQKLRVSSRDEAVERARDLGAIRPVHPGEPAGGGGDAGASVPETLEAMENRFAARAGGRAVRYRIVIRGEIPEPLVGPLQGMTVVLAGDESVLTGYLVDQSQLQGALSSLNGLGVEIVSVNPADENTTN